MDVKVYVYVGLFVFGVAYALMVNRLQKYLLTEGFTALLVVFGCGVTLGACAILEYQVGHITTAQVFLAFAASGFPMTLGDVASYLFRRYNGRHFILTQIGNNDDDETTRMA